MKRLFGVLAIVLMLGTGTQKLGAMGDLLDGIQEITQEVQQGLQRLGEYVEKLEGQHEVELRAAMETSIQTAAQEQEQRELEAAIAASLQAHEQERARQHTTRYPVMDSRRGQLRQQKRKSAKPIFPQF